MDVLNNVDDVIETYPEKPNEDVQGNRCKKQLNNYLCSLCESVNEKVPATMVCTDDDILLCNGCGCRHKAYGLAKDHTILSLNEYIKEEFTCDLCESVDQIIPGYAFCNDCTEPVVLCIDCSNRHTATKAFRNHTMNTNLFAFNPDNIGSDSDVASEHDFRTSSSSLQSDISFTKKSTRVVQSLHSSNIQPHEGKKENCSLCADNMEYNPASSFCKSCPVPEPLCESCSYHHKKERFSKNHDICCNLDELHVYIEEHCTLCSQCSHENKIEIAIAFCKSCGTKEPLCNQCLKDHTLQKEFRNHEICNDMQKHQTLNNFSCEHCQFQGIKKRANCFCGDCLEPEPLCNQCAAKHTKQSKYRSHLIKYDFAHFHRKEHEVLCALCNSISAKRSCVQCEKCMCEPCAAQHLMHTANEHVLLDDVVGFSFLCEPPAQLSTHGQEDNLKAGVDQVGPSLSEPEVILEYSHGQELPTYPMPKMQNYLQKDSMSGSKLSLCEEITSSSKEKKRIKKDKKKPDGRSRRSKSSLLEPKTDTVSMTCGKPVMYRANFDTIEIQWEEPAQGADYYSVFYKRKKDIDWKDFPVQWKSNRAVIDGLQSDTSYEFKVLCVKDSKNGIQSEPSSAIKTTQSPAAKYIRFSKKCKDGNPTIYKFPSKENMAARNEKDKTRELIIGDPKCQTVEEKTLMLVGATGSGKSTLVDGIINYILGVQFHDKFRFTVVELEEDEQKTHDQAMSQTEWVTVYKIIPDKLSKIRFTLNIIDTPGFGDTRGIQRDNKIIDQIRGLFLSNVRAFLDAVCFIVKAPDARLTAVQTYIFHQILALFGKDMANNFCNFITFADRETPPVLACLKSANIPARVWFKFNNSGLFASNSNNNQAESSWEMGCKSFENFFKGLHHFQAKSLALTNDVLKERENLQTILSNIQPQVSFGLTKLSELQEQLSIYEKHKNDLKDNKNFSYKVETVKQIKDDLPQGVHVTNCLQCNITCHDYCRIPDDENKKNCAAMHNGFCTVCEKKCKWDQHKNAKYRFRYITITEERTYEEMKKKYEEAKGKKLSNGNYLHALQKDVEDLYKKVHIMMKNMNRCKDRLKEIALRPDPLSTSQHIEQMIQAEEIEKNPGFQNRIKMLKEYQQLADTDKNFERISHGLYNVREQIQNATGFTTE